MVRSPRYKEWLATLPEHVSHIGLDGALDKNPRELCSLHPLPSGLVNAVVGYSIPWRKSFK